MDIVVKADESLVIIVDEPEREARPGFMLQAWYGVLETKSQDWNMSQIVDYMGNPEWVIQILKIKNRVATDITDMVLRAAEEMQG